MMSPAPIAHFSIALPGILPSRGQHSRGRTLLRSCQPSKAPVPARLLYDTTVRPRLSGMRQLCFPPLIAKDRPPTDEQYSRGMQDDAVTHLLRQYKRCNENCDSQLQPASRCFVSARSQGMRCGASAEQPRKPAQHQPGKNAGGRSKQH